MSVRTNELLLLQSPNKCKIEQRGKVANVQLYNAIMSLIADLLTKIGRQITRQSRRYSRRGVCDTTRHSSANQRTSRAAGSARHRCCCSARRRSSCVTSPGRHVTFRPVPRRSCSTSTRLPAAGHCRPSSSRSSAVLHSSTASR